MDVNLYNSVFLRSFSFNLYPRYCMSIRVINELATADRLSDKLNCIISTADSTSVTVLS